jgi:ATP-dependent protease ClpP protease subunit
MALNTELADNLAYGVDLKNRRIYFGVNIDSFEAQEATDFSPSSVEMAVRALHRMVADSATKPIELYMNSYGGDTYAMLRLYDEILACPCQIKFIGGGAIMSSATFIMVACDERYLHRHATVMVHELSDDMGRNKHTDINISSEENHRLMSILTEIYASNSKMSKDFWADIIQRDVYLSAAEAVSLGLADKIIEPKKRGNLRKVRTAALKKDQDNKELKKLITDIYRRTKRNKIPKIELNEIKKEMSDPTIIIEEVKEESSTPQSS